MKMQQGGWLNTQMKTYSITYSWFNGRNILELIMMIYNFEIYVSKLKK